MKETNQRERKMKGRMRKEKIKPTEKKRVNALRKQYFWKIGNRINETKLHRHCIEMWRGKKQKSQ